MGKAHNNNKFELTGAGVLQKPPKKLMATVQKLEARYQTEGSKMPTFMEEMLTRSADMRENGYVYQGA